VKRPNCTHPVEQHYVERIMGKEKYPIERWGKLYCKACGWYLRPYKRKVAFYAHSKRTEPSP
jgi:hypothetical protein